MEFYFNKFPSFVDNDNDDEKVGYIATRVIKLLMKYDSVVKHFAQRISDRFCLIGISPVIQVVCSDQVGGSFLINQHGQMYIYIAKNQLWRYSSNTELAIFKVIRHEMRHFIQYCIVEDLSGDPFNTWCQISDQSTMYFDSILELDAFATEGNNGMDLNSLYDYIQNAIESLE